MHRFKLTLLFLIISILTATFVNAQNNNGAKSNVNTAPNNTKENADPNVNKSPATTPVATPAPAVTPDDNKNSEPEKKTASEPKLQIVFSGADPNDKDIQVIKAKRTSDPLKEFTFLAKDTETKALLTKLGEGDIVSVNYEPGKDVNILKDISIEKKQLKGFSQYVLFLIALLGLFFLSRILLGTKFRGLIVGEDNRYSKSKVQIVAWFFVLISSYIAFFINRWYYSDYNLFGGIGIPTNLLMLSGLSALTFAAAKGITQSNVEAGAVKPERNPEIGPRFADLFQDDKGNVDLGDFQMIIVTFLAVVTYVIQVFGFFEVLEMYRSVSLPDVDSTILATFGLGQGAYLIKKAVTEGPSTEDEKKNLDKPVNPDDPKEPDVLPAANPGLLNNPQDPAALPPAVITSPSTVISSPPVGGGTEEPAEDTVNDDETDGESDEDESDEDVITSP